MKRALVLVALAIVSMGLAASRVSSAGRGTSFAHTYVPAGSLFVSGSPGFCRSLAAWNASGERKAWPSERHSSSSGIRGCSCG